MISCVFCRGPIRSSEAYQRVFAWERKASSNSRRGGSDIALREPSIPTEWACRWCIEKLKRGVAVGQEELA